MIPRAAQLDVEAWSAWREAVSLAGVDRALRELYAQLDAAVAARGPTCWTSGKCCKFDAYGHRMYVTGLEVAWFLEQVEGRRSRVEASPSDTDRVGKRVTLPQWSSDRGSCPYQVDGLCSTHGVRPLGCRVFFCQSGTEDWQQDLYEDFLSRLRKLHEEHDLPYRYLDWLVGLSEAREAAAARPADG
ncbi:MAG: hypothetical protein AAFX76_04455 [Planctomycetota bacterium]